MPEVAIRQFVRETLGCTCPEEVFAQIEDEHCPARDGLGAYRRLVIGERLLIYIVTLGPGGAAAGWKDRVDEELGGQLRALLAAGRDERDRLGLNRFRAVLAAPAPETLAPLAQRALAALYDADPKVHLHLVPLDARPAPCAQNGMSDRATDQ